MKDNRLITPKRSTKWLDKCMLYEVVSEQDDFGYYRVREPRCIGAAIRYIYKSNVQEVKIV